MPGGYTFVKLTAYINFIDHHGVTSPALYHIGLCVLQRIGSRMHNFYDHGDLIYMCVGT